MKKIKMSIQNSSLSLVGKKHKAFTLAEILLSLTVIGIVAAIALPSLLGNANERAWETQKKALYTRFSQALPLLPSLNGYGTLEGTNSSGKRDEEGYIPQNVTEDTGAETFVRDGISKVMKVANICAIPKGKTGSEAAKYLSDCGLPDKIIALNGSTTFNLSDIVTIGGLNSSMSDGVADTTYSSNLYRALDTKAAAFETVNGESILVYYNTNCEPDLKETIWHRSQPKICANFIYDLNGKKGPNTVGKDIGAITALYSTDPVIVAPNPITTDVIAITHEDAMAACKEKGEDTRIPNIDELTAMFCNKNIFSMNQARNYWSSTTYNSNYWHIYTDHGGRTPQEPGANNFSVRCVKR